MEKIKLDKIDKKLLSHIFNNFRQPITKIAKKCRISREQAEYRIKKYEEKGLIRGYFTIFNLYSIGYTNNYIIKLKVKNPSKEKLLEIKNNNKTIIFTRILCYGNWDYIINIITKDKKEVLNLISKLYNLWNNSIIDYEIFEPIELQYFPLKIFGDKKEKKIEIKQTKNKKITEIDKKIMNEISDNAKIKLIDLSKKINEKVETVNYRLKKLEKEKIILGYRIFLNLNIIGHQVAELIIKFNNLSQTVRKKIISYGESEEKISAVGIGIGKHNVLFQITYKTQKELTEEINKIKKEFSKEIVEYELIQIEDELKPNTI